MAAMKERIDKHKNIPLHLYREIECLHHIHETCHKFYMLNYSETNIMHIWLKEKKKNSKH